MRVARVSTNETCNQNCAFCHTRRRSEDLAFVQASAVRERIDSAVQSGASTVVLTGGEPTMRRDLPTLVAYARRAGAATVRLETNGSLVDHAAAHALADAGLTVAQLHLPAWGHELERINRDPGGFAGLSAGAQAFADAGIRIEVSVPLVRDNLETVGDLPAHLRASGWPVTALVIGTPHEAPDEGSLAPLPDLARALTTVEAAARREGLAVRLDPDGFFAPCLLPDPARLAYLYALTPGGAERPGYQRIAECRSCAIADRCPGLPVSRLAREGAPAVRPIAQDRVRRRLSVISSVDEQVRRELFQDDVYQRDSGSTVAARIVRINFRCNQACSFCFVSTHLPTADEEDITAAIVQISRAHGVLVLSGGEPTLNPRLLDYAALGRREGALAIELQTNAVRLAEPGYADAIAQAGVDRALISLHGARAEISDAITVAPGTFERTLLGIDAWVGTGREARLNFVFCRTNLTEFPAVVDLVATRWPTASLVVSFVAPSTDVVPRTAGLIPRYADVSPFLAEGLDRARRHGVAVHGFESMCGIPLCLVPAALGSYFSLAEIPPGFDRGEFVKAEACHGCALDRRCFGLRRGYAELHGTSELRPVLPDAT